SPVIHATRPRWHLAAPLIFSLPPLREIGSPPGRANTPWPGALAFTTFMSATRMENPSRYFGVALTESREMWSNRSSPPEMKKGARPGIDESAPDAHYDTEKEGRRQPCWRRNREETLSSTRAGMSSRPCSWSG